jgi:hypothetical protein
MSNRQWALFCGVLLTGLVILGKSILNNTWEMDEADLLGRCKRFLEFLEE